MSTALFHMNQTNGFTVVEPKNLDEISHRLATNQGRILLAGPHLAAEYYDAASLSFYDRPELSRSSHGLSVSTNRGREKRGGEDWQTGWEKDRNYLLRLVPHSSGDPDWDAARSLFQKLRVGSFELKIGFESATSQSFAPKMRTVLFIPRHTDPKAAFAYAFGQVTLGLNQALENDKRTRFRFLPEHVGTMVAYVLQDLKDGVVFTANVGAGRAADAMVGF